MLAGPRVSIGMSLFISSFLPLLCSQNGGGGLRRAGHGQFLQVVHEDLETDVVGQDRGSRLLKDKRAGEREENG